MTSMAAQIFLLLILGFSSSVSLAKVPMGSYQGAGCDGVKNYANFKKWLGRPSDRFLDFADDRSWQQMLDGIKWSATCWKNAGVKGPQMTFTIGLAVAGQNVGHTIAGNGDKYYLAIAKDLVAKGFGDAVIRLGHEMNGNWYSWSAVGREKQYAQAFREVVEIFRSVPGQKFKFNWCFAAGWMGTIKFTDFYPGNAHVDIIGLDVYAVGGQANPTDYEVWYIMTKNYSLDYLVSLGKKYGKPIAVDEWGIGTPMAGPGVYGPGDNPKIMSQMLNYIEKNGISYSNYWDFNIGYKSRISNGERPKQGAVFKAFYNTDDVIQISMTEDAFQGDALASVKIDGVVVASNIKVTALRGQTPNKFQYTVPKAVGHTVEVSFNNDSYGTSGDRNLYVNGIALNGVAVAATSANLYSSGSKKFYVGDFDTITVSLSEQAYNGDAKATVSIDGKVVLSERAITALHLSQQKQTFTFKVLGATSHTVQVSFLNDAYGAGGDRNLFVDGLTVNGVLQPGSTAVLYSQQTKSFTVKD